MITQFTPAHIGDVIRIWNAASHSDYPINERFLAYNLIPATGEVIEGRVAIQNSWLDKPHRGPSICTATRCRFRFAQLGGRLASGKELQADPHWRQPAPI